MPAEAEPPRPVASPVRGSARGAWAGAGAAGTTGAGAGPAAGAGGSGAVAGPAMWRTAKACGSTGDVGDWSPIGTKKPAAPLRPFSRTARTARPGVAPLAAAPPVRLFGPRRLMKTRSVARRGFHDVRADAQAGERADDLIGGAVEHDDVVTLAAVPHPDVAPADDRHAVSIGAGGGRIDRLDQRVRSSVEDVNHLAQKHCHPERMRRI